MKEGPDEGKSEDASFFWRVRSQGTSRLKQAGRFEIMPGKKRGGRYNMRVHKYIRLLSAPMMAAGNAPVKRTEAFFRRARDTFGVGIDSFVQ